jgi:hypothetical protein
MTAKLEEAPTRNNFLRITDGLMRILNLSASLDKIPVKVLNQYTNAFVQYDFPDIECLYLYVGKVESAAQFLDVLAPKVSTLRLDANHPITSSFLIELTNFIRKLIRCENISFFGANWKPEEIISLLNHGVKENANLRNIGVQFGSITMSQENVEQIAMFVENFPGMLHLDLFIRDVNMDLIFEAFSSSHQIESLTLYVSEHLRWEKRSFDRLLSICPNLRKLCIHWLVFNSDKSDEILQAVGSNVNKIDDLFLLFEDGTKPELGKQFLDSLKSSSLRIFRIGYNSLDIDFVKIPMLEELEAPLVWRENESESFLSNNPNLKSGK